MRRHLQSTIIIKIIIIITLLIGLISTYLLFTSKVLPHVDKNNTHEKIQIGGSFMLQNQHGNRFSSEELKGKLRLIYFGFTKCPVNRSNNCFTTLNKLSQITKLLNKNNINISLIFITIDPVHDTSEILREYLKKFDPGIIGLTGSSRQIQQIVDKFKIANNYNYVLSANHVLDNSPFVYLIDANGNYIKHYCVSLMLGELTGDM